MTSRRFCWSPHGRTIGGRLRGLGWTGFAIPTLRRRYSILVTGLILGVWWSAWHLLTEPLGEAHGIRRTRRVRVPAGDRCRRLRRIPDSIQGPHGLGLRPHGAPPVAMLMHVSLTASLLILNPLGISGAHLVSYSFALAAALWVVVAAIAFGSRKEISRWPPRRQRRESIPLAWRRARAEQHR